MRTGEPVALALPTSGGGQVLSSWDMSVSILNALDVALAKAETEHLETTIAAGGSPFGKGVQPAAQLIGILNHARRALGPDMHQLARSSGRVI